MIRSALFFTISLVFVAAPAQARTSYHRYSTHHSYGPSTGRHYTNVNGLSVHSPMYAGPAEWRDSSVRGWDVQLQPTS